jgi:hypothetical protein
MYDYVSEEWANEVFMWGRGLNFAFFRTIGLSSVEPLSTAVKLQGGDNHYVYANH